MKVVITSESELKVKPCEKIFGRRSNRLRILPLPAPSGVNEQPMNDETVRGARNRIDNARALLTYKGFYEEVQNALKNATKEEPSGALYESIELALRTAKQEVPDADFWVSIENGIFEENGRYIDRAVVAVMNKAGNISIAYSEGVEFPRDAVEEARRRGFDKWTVGKVMEEWGRVRKHNNPHIDLPPDYKSRDVYIEETLAKAVENLDKMERTKGLLQLPRSMGDLFRRCGQGLKGLFSAKATPTTAPPSVQEDVDYILSTRNEHHLRRLDQVLLKGRDAVLGNGKVMNYLVIHDEAQYVLRLLENRTSDAVSSLFLSAQGQPTEAACWLLLSPQGESMREVLSGLMHTDIRDERLSTLNAVNVLVESGKARHVAGYMTDLASSGNNFSYYSYQQKLFQHAKKIYNEPGVVEALIGAPRDSLRVRNTDVLTGWEAVLDRVCEQQQNSPSTKRVHWRK